MTRFTPEEAWMACKRVAFWARMGCPSDPTEEARLGQDTALVEDALIDYKNLVSLGLKPVCDALGWQGGTVNQVTGEIKTMAKRILDLEDTILAAYRALGIETADPEDAIRQANAIAPTLSKIIEAKLAENCVWQHHDHGDIPAY